MFGNSTTKENIKDLLHFEFLDFEPLASIQKHHSLFQTFKLKHTLKLNTEKLLFGNTAYKSSGKSIQGKVWAVVSSLNNFNSLLFLEKEIDSLEFVTTNSLSVTKGLEGIPQLSWYNAKGHKDLFKKIYEHYESLDRNKAISIKNNIFEAIGMLEAAIEILKQGKPKALIFTNDHTVKNRSLLQAALFLRIPAIYIQHASVSEYFPPLIFDLSLLEGEDALKKYMKCGKLRGEVELIGMPKFDRYVVDRKFISEVSQIAVCANISDQQSKIIALLEYLEKEFPKTRIYFRPHPRDDRTYNFNNMVEYSDSKKESVFELLKKVDFLIAGHTSTHLEAALLNIPSLYFNLGEAGFGDYYGYIKNGLMEEISQLKHIKPYIEKVNKSSDPYKKARYYNAAVDADFEGRSGKLAGRIIRAFLTKNMV